MSLRALVHQHGLNALTATLFALAVWRLGFSPVLPAVLAFIVGGVLLAVIDAKAQRLPTRLVYITLAAVGAGLLFASLVERDWVPLATALAGATLMAGAFFVIWYVSRQVSAVTMLGLGDVRLAGLLGLLLGWFGLPYVFYGAVAGNLVAVPIAIAMCVRERRLLTHFSFGPALITGTLAVVLMYG